MNRFSTILLLAALAFPLSGFTQTDPTVPQPLTPLREVLNPDGTLNTPPDFKGSLDPTGWRMMTGKDGAPRFVQEAKAILFDPVDSSWDDRFYLAPFSNGVNALAIYGSEFYVGGTFTIADTIVANHIAKWNGSSWSSLGSGMNGDVLALAVIGTALYAGGTFTTAGGVSANYIAKWNGSSWSSLGSGMDAAVIAFAGMGTDVYAGGYFLTAGGVSAIHIAKWNGSSWSSLGSGTDGYVNVLCATGTDLFAGGAFTYAGGVSANRIAKWNGSSWSSLGSGMNGNINDLAVIGTDLYAGGYFTTAGGGSANYIAKWNGSSWFALGSGMNAVVFALTVIGTDLFAGGSFTTAEGGSANYIAKWDGTSWSTLGSGMNGFVVDLTATGTDLYAGGGFSLAGGVGVNRVAKWDGSSWSSLGASGSGMNLSVAALAVMGTDLYAGGSFTSAGGVGANRVAKWDGSSWSSLGSGVNGDVGALAVIGTDLYAGGSFTTAGGVSANYIAKWNGSSWSTLGSGMNGAVYALAAVGTDLYTGGSFTTAGGVSASCIAKWDGSSWFSLGSGVNGNVYALAAMGIDLYAGGFFSTAGGVSANRIAKWNGSNWSALGSGMNSAVRALAVIGTDLYAGGFFTSAGGVGANRVAKWNGTSWYALGQGMNDNVIALTVKATDLYAGGWFTSAGGGSASHLARWNGTDWYSLGSGTNGSVSALALPTIGLYVGGSFTIAGENPSMFIARWTGVVPLPNFVVTPESLAYGSVSVGDSLADTVYVKNTGIAALNVVSAISDNSNFHVMPLSATIPAGDSLAFRITFVPSSGGPVNANIVFLHDASSSPDTVTAAGTGLGPLAAGDYTVGISVFSRLVGKNLTCEVRKRKVTNEVALSDPRSRQENRHRENQTSPSQTETKPVEVEEKYGVLMADGQPYGGPFFVPVTTIERKRLGLAESVEGVYPTITAALTDLDTSGLLGHVRFLLADTLYPSETFPLDLKVSAVLKASPSATITLKPDVGVSSHIAGLSPIDDPILRVRADYVTIDGSNTEGGTTRDLAITNYNGVAVALSVWDLINFPDDTVSHVTVKNTILADTTGGSGTLTVGPSFAYAGGPYSDITIENNEMHGGKFGIWISGMEANPGRNVIVRDNILHGVHGIGIIAKYSDGVQISGNDLSNFVPVFFGYLEGIRSELGATNVIVERNVVHDLGSPTSGLPGGNGIAVLTLDSLSNVLVANNLIYGMTGAGASFSWTDNPVGIRVQAPGAGVRVYHNSISLSGSTLSEASALSMGIGVGSGARPDIRNNIIVNNLGLAGGTGIGSCGVYFQDTTNLASTLDYNLYYVNPSGTGIKATGMIDTSPSTALAAWQAATGQETHGVVGDPLFVSATDLHVSTPGSPASNAGVFLSDATRDFDNEVRSSLSADIGADEFAPVPSGVAVGLVSGWNMLSNPITAPNDSVTLLYPGSAFGYAFSFSSIAGYQQSYRMSNGRGYWAKLMSGGTQTLLGAPRSEDSVAVSPGWNMVGSISYPVDTAAITSIPAGIRTSQWYGYGPGYNPSAEIVPGKAYWVKASVAGKFFLSFAPVPPSAKAGAGDRNILAELNTLTITDAAGASQTLYFGSNTKAGLSTEMFEMPPAPPSGVLDARFSATGGETPAGGSMVQTHNVGGGSFPITLQAGAYPVTVSWDVAAGSPGYILRDGIGAGIHLEGQGTWEITQSGVNRLVLETTGRNEIPREFVLFQNYPNPFNPMTTIRFALPVASMVTVEIFNILGQQVKSLVNEDLPAGYHTVEWNGTGNAGQQLGSGIYFLRLAASAAAGTSFTDMRKLVLVK